MLRSWLVVVLAVGLGLALQPVSGSALTHLQTVDGRVLVGSSNGPELTRAARLADGESTNGVFGYVIDLAPETVGGRFTLEELAGAALEGDLAIRFYTDLGAGTDCASYVPVTDEGGSICGTHALVWAPSGLDVSFRYQGSIPLPDDDGSGCAALAPPTPAGTHLEADGAALALGDGRLVDIAVAPDGSVAYGSNAVANRVEVIDLEASALRPAVPVGSTPWGVDVDVDGEVVYVANSGESTISVVDAVEGVELERIDVIPAGSEDERPLQLAVVSPERLLFNTTFDDGFGASMFELDLASRTVVERTDFAGGSTRRTVLERTTDRSRVGIVMTRTPWGEIFWYDSDTDTFTAEKETARHNSLVATDATGDRMLVGSAPMVVDRDLWVEGTVAFAPDTAAIALDPCGRRGYRLTSDGVEVLDLDRFLVAGSYQLTGGSSGGALAITPDGSDLVVGTNAGVTIIDLTIESFTAAAPPEAAPDRPGFVGVAGGRVARIVVASDGTRAYATNPALNQVEVIDLATQTLLAPVPSGSGPIGLDLALDERSLVVADSDGEFLSVLDIERRRIDRRILVPPEGHAYEQPYEVVVTDEHRALLTKLGGSWWTGVTDVDLATGSSTVRQDVHNITSVTHLARSYDRSSVALGEGHNASGPFRLYDAATDTVGPVSFLDVAVRCVAADGDGDRFLINSELVFDREGERLGTIEGWGGHGCAISPDGRTGYRVADDSVEILDLENFVVTGTWELPDTYWFGPLALTPDGSTLLVGTETGIALVDVSAT